MEVIKKYLRTHLFLSKSSVVAVSLLLFFGFFVPLEFADAFPNLNPLAWAADTVLFFIAAIILNLPALVFVIVLQLILAFTSLAVYFAGWLLMIIINMDIPYTRCTDAVMALANDCFVQTAWLVVRDITNMFLIVALVVIGLGTILRIEGYGYKKALLPLLIVALLVNFSKVIVGIVVDMSTIIMGIFLEEITGLEALTSSFKNQGDLIGNHLVSFKVFTFTGNVTFIMKTLLFIAFQSLFAFMIFLFAAVFLARFAGLWLVTIASPIAFASAIFPATKKFFQWWRGQLISWSLIGVTAGFALWLCKLFANKLEDFRNPISDAHEEALKSIFLESNPLETMFLDLLPYVLHMLICGALFMLALKTNAIGANTIITTGKKWGMAARDGAKHYATSKVIQQYGGGMQTALQRASGSRVAQAELRLSKNFALGLGGPIRMATKFGEQKLRAAQRLEEAKKEAQSLTERMRMEQLKSEANPDIFKALMEVQLTEDHREIDKLLLDPKHGEAFRKRLAAVITNISLRGVEKEIINQRPDFAYASTKVNGPETIKDDDAPEKLKIRQLFRDEKITEQEARNALFVISRRAEQVKTFKDGALTDAGVIIGLEEHPSIELFEDLGTSNPRMNNIATAYTNKHRGNRKAVFADIAARLQDKNLKYAEDLLLLETDIDGNFKKDEAGNAIPKNPELYSELAKNVQKISRNFVTRLVEHSEKQGEEALNHLLRTVHNHPDESVREDLHKQFSEKLFSDPLIRNRMRKALVDEHEKHSPKKTKATESDEPPPAGTKSSAPPPAGFVERPSGFIVRGHPAPPPHERGSVGIGGAARSGARKSEREGQENPRERAEARRRARETGGPARTAQERPGQERRADAGTRRQGGEQAPEQTPGPGLSDKERAIHAEIGRLGNQRDELLAERNRLKDMPESPQRTARIRQIDHEFKMIRDRLKDFQS